MNISVITDVKNMVACGDMDGAALRLALSVLTTFGACTGIEKCTRKRLRRLVSCGSQNFFTLVTIISTINDNDCAQSPKILEVRNLVKTHLYPIRGDEPPNPTYLII